MLMSKIYVVNSDMKNVIGMSDLNMMFNGPGPLVVACRKHNFQSNGQFLECPFLSESGNLNRK